jgi:catechol 2,3-dioxygenase-like lactoylglutathione lyase family enzyme
MVQAVFSQVNLVVKDMDKTLAFYRRLGVEIPENGIWSTPSGVHHVTIGGDGAVDMEFDSHALARRYNRGYEAERGRVLLGFSLPTREAVDALFDELVTHEHQALQPPYDAFWGARYAIVEDPDGNPVGLMSPSDDAHRAPPPAL